MNTYEFSSCQNDLIKKIRSDHKILGRQFSESPAFLHILQTEILISFALDCLFRDIGIAKSLKR